MNSGIWECKQMPNFRGNENLCKLGKKYLNDLLCEFGPFCLQHSKTFDISNAFLRVTIAELSKLKQVHFLAHPTEIWRLKVHVDTQTDRTTNLLISSNVHYVHLAEITISIKIRTKKRQ